MYVVDIHLNRHYRLQSYCKQAVCNGILVVCLGWVYIYTYCIVLTAVALLGYKYDVFVRFINLCVWGTGDLVGITGFLNLSQAPVSRKTGIISHQAQDVTLFLLRENKSLLLLLFINYDRS